MTNRKNRTNSIDIEFDIEFNIEFNVESKTRNRTRTSSGEKRRSMSIGSIESIILDDDIDHIDDINDHIHDIDDKIDNIYNELLFKTNKTIVKSNKTPDLFVNKEMNRRKRDVYFDKDGLMKQPSPKISYFAQIMMPDNWVKSTKK